MPGSPMPETDAVGLSVYLAIRIAEISLGGSNV